MIICCSLGSRPGVTEAIDTGSEMDPRAIGHVGRCTRHQFLKDFTRFTVVLALFLLKSKLEAMNCSHMPLVNRHRLLNRRS